MGTDAEDDAGICDEAQRYSNQEEIQEEWDQQDTSPRDWQRFYMGYKERFVDDCILQLQGGAVTVTLVQAPSAKSAQTPAGPSGRGNGKRSSGQMADRKSDPALTGTTVWDGGVVLSQALTCSPWFQRHMEGRPWPSGSAKPHCLELGAGTGAVGLSLAACHMAASVTITDIPDMLPHINVNVKRNAAAIQMGPRGQATGRQPRGPGSTATAAAATRPAAGMQSGMIPRPPAVLVRPLRWGPPGEDIDALVQEQQQQQQRPMQTAPVQPLPGPPYDVIVGSDLIYYTYSEATPHSKLLLWSLERLSSPQSLIYLALSLHHNPEEVEHFLGLAEERFDVTRLHQEVPLAWRVPDSLVVLLRLKPTEIQAGSTGVLLAGSAGEPQAVEVATAEIQKLALQTENALPVG